MAKNNELTKKNSELQKIGADSLPALVKEVEDKIAVIRGRDVIADANIAFLYGAETREVNQAVCNNPERFPEDYMFELTKSELLDLRSKILTTKVSNKSRSVTKAFTEKGLYTICLLPYCMASVRLPQPLPSSRPLPRCRNSSASCWSCTRRKTRRSKLPRCSTSGRCLPTS